MDAGTGGPARPLRSVGDAAAPTPEAIEEAIRAVLAAAPSGLAVRALAPALAERLGIALSDLPAGRVQVALGLLVAGGRVDESGGRLVLVEQEHRRAG